MVAHCQKTGRKILVRRHQTKSSEAMKTEKTSKIKGEVAMAVGEVTDEAQISIYIACIMRRTHTIG
jgi:hypothetical protein